MLQPERKFAPQRDASKESFPDSAFEKIISTDLLLKLRAQIELNEPKVEKNGRAVLKAIKEELRPVPNGRVGSIASIRLPDKTNQEIILRELIAYKLVDPRDWVK